VTWTYKLFGLPSHMLVIHLVVVGIPVAGIATIAMAVRPQWRTGKFGLTVILMDALAVVGTWLARITGEQFFDKSPGLRTLKEVIDHKNLAMTLIWYMIGMLVAAVLLVLAEKYERPPLTTIFAAIAVAAAAAAVVQTVRVGDSGAQHWAPYVNN